MPQTLTPKNSVSNYPGLLREVRAALLAGQRRIEQEKVQTYWNTGKLIHEHLLHHQDRAEYGTEVIARLSRDLEVSPSVLHRTLKFYRGFPKIVARGPQLAWSHYRKLITVTDEEQRFLLADLAAQKEWTTEELSEKIKLETGDSGETDASDSAVRTEAPVSHGSRNAKLIAKRGEVYTYRMIRPDKIHPGKAQLKIDLGFSSFREASLKGADNLRAGQIAVSEWIEGDTYRLKPVPSAPRLRAITAAQKVSAVRESGRKQSAESESPENQLYTYYAEVERVVDGDTIIAIVDLGFGITTRQYLRLRGIDCPEIATADGKRAKAFVQKQLEAVPYVVICSSKSDKYDRYLADVYYGKESKEKFLNNELLDEGLAVRM